MAKRASLSKSVRSAARRCSMQADQRLQVKLRALEQALEERGCHVKCWIRPLGEPDSVYWPPVEIAILVDIADFETHIPYLMECLLVGKEIFEQEWSFRVAPVMEGAVLPAFALQPTSGILFSEDMTLPDMDFSNNWNGYIDHPFHSSEVSDSFDKAMGGLHAVVGDCELP